MNLDTTVPTELNQAAFDAFLEMRDDPQWLQDQRREAWAAFSQMQWPARNSEEWSRTDIRLLNVEQYPEALAKLYRIISTSPQKILF